MDDIRYLQSRMRGDFDDRDQENFPSPTSDKQDCKVALQSSAPCASSNDEE